MLPVTMFSSKKHQSICQVQTKPEEDLKMVRYIYWELFVQFMDLLSGLSLKFLINDLLKYFGQAHL